MLIAETNLRMLVREMLLESETPEDVGAGREAASDVVSSIADRSKQNLDGLKKFVDGVIAGSVVVTSRRNTTDQNLFVSAFLASYIKNFAKGDTALLNVGTSYPAKQIFKAQQMMGLQADGDFGRQTLVALASGGKVILDPTTAQTLRMDSIRRSRVAFLLAMKASMMSPLTPADLSRAMVDPQSTPAGARKVSYDRLADAPPPAVSSATANTSASDRGRK